MSPVTHTLISAAFSAGFGAATRSWTAAAACFLSGIFIDIDHVVDFWLARKKVLLSYSELHRFCGKEKLGRLFLWLHSYELLGLLWIGAWISGFNAVLVGIVSGMTVHLLADQFANPVRPLAFFLTYRIRHKFDKKYIFPKDYYDEMS